MFWRRKKLPEDEEPLVPHGLIWQATEAQASTELPPDMWDNFPKEVRRSPAEPVEMPVRLSTAAEPYSQQKQAAQDPGDVSVPMTWSRVDDTELARRARLVDTAVSFPYRKPVVGAAVPKPVEHESQKDGKEPAKLELVYVSPLTPLRAARSKQFKNLVARFRSLKLPKISSISQRVRGVKVFARIKDSARNGVQTSTQGLNVIRQRSGSALGAAKLRWAAGVKDVFSHSRSGIQRVGDNVRGIDMGGPARIFHRARTLRVRIRISGSTWRSINSLAGKAKAARRSVRHALPRDSRLWASVAMGGLSALLALGVISALRHYGPGKGFLKPATETVDAAAPSPTTQPPSRPVPREAITEKPSPLAGGSRKDNLVATKPVAPETQLKENASPSHARKPRVRRNTDEDDYVAADTYVYYGLAGKPKR
jgi:hypothetical protein